MIRCHRYALLAGVVFVLLAIQTFNQQWTSDFWLHAASIKALLVDPINPGSPILSIDAPHSHYSPYTVVLALIGRLFALGPVGALTLAALANAVFLLVSLRVFVRAIGCRDGAPFWVLLSTLFLWGVGPWRWSGYLHANSIGFSLPYPAVFATALTLLLAATLRHYLEHPRWQYLVALALGVPVVGLSHPPTALWLVVLFGALLVSASWTATKAVGLGTAAVISLGLMALWPYYPAFEVAGVFDSSSSFATSNAVLVTSLPSRLGLALVFGLPVLVARVRRDRRDPMVVAFAGVALVVALAMVTNTYWLARVVPLGVLMLHVAVGDWAAGVEAEGLGLRPLRWRVVGVWALIGALILGAVSLRRGLVRMVPRPVTSALLGADPRLDPMVEPWAELADALPPGAVVAAVDEPSVELAGLAGSWVSSSVWTAPFVADEVENRRRADTKLIVSPSTPASQRSELIDRYGVTHLIVIDGPGQVEGFGEVILRSNGYVLIEV